MSKKIDPPKQDNQIAKGKSIDKEKVHQALLNLRNIGKNLPKVDAEIIIRESRESRDRGNA